MTNFDKTIDEEALLAAIDSPFKDNIEELLLESNRKTEEYLKSTADRFSVSDDHLKAKFNI